MDNYTIVDSIPRLLIQATDDYEVEISKRFIHNETDILCTLGAYRVSQVVD